MAVKIYEECNYIIISGSDESPLIDLNDSKLNITCHEKEDDIFLIYSLKLGRHLFQIGPDLVDKDNLAYTRESFIDFYRKNTGSFNGALLSGASGVADYDDAFTDANPINITGGVFSYLTNDTLGPSTDEANLPKGVTSLWNASLNEFDFSQLEIGTIIQVRFDLDITILSPFEEAELSIDFAIGGDPFSLRVFRRQYKTAGVYLTETFTTFFYIKGNNMINYPAKPKFKTDSNSTVVVNGWLCSISNLKKCR
jgi:hypothetical protein